MCAVLAVIGWVGDTVTNGAPNPVGTLLAVLFLAGFAWAERTRARLLKTRPHHVRVYQVLAEQEPYFFAQCDECRWLRAPFESADEARQVGHEHSHLVAKRIVTVGIDPSSGTGIPNATS
jgi:hypothetical protein